MFLIRLRKTAIAPLNPRHAENVLFMEVFSKDPSASFPVELASSSARVLSLITSWYRRSRRLLKRKNNNYRPSFCFHAMPVWIGRRADDNNCVIIFILSSSVCKSLTLKNKNKLWNFSLGRMDGWMKQINSWMKV